MTTPPSRLPVIGITADVTTAPCGGDVPRSEPVFFSPERYCRAVQQAGGAPCLLPATRSRPVMRRILALLDGLLISGGNFDIAPRRYGEKPRAALGELKEGRTDFELELALRALERDLPVLGICGGAQAINVALGGTLYQDIRSELPEALEHEQGERKHSGGHRIRVHAGTRLLKIFGRRTLEVNTTHHQAVKTPGKGLIVNATSEDGLIEGIESPGHSFALGVQWHPEALCGADPAQTKLFFAFVASCRRRGKKT